MKTPAVSVVMGVFNGAPWVEAAVESVCWARRSTISN